jgi:DNA-binding CsgD family transcriptional regulator
MAKSQRLSARDMVTIYRLVGACRDLGHDSAAWRQHLLADLNRKLGGVVGTSQEIRECTSKVPVLVGDLNVGWADPSDEKYRARFIAEYGLGRDPHYEAMSLRYRERPELLVCARHQLVSNQEWYGSAYYNEFRRPTRHDSSVYAMYPLQGRLDTVFGCALTRAVGEPAFSARDRRYCYWLFHELGPLIGRQLAAPGEPTLVDLPPRLRQMMQCLLEGDSEKQAAVRMNVSRATAHEYVTSLYRRFDVNSRAELMARWLRCHRQS